MTKKNRKHLQARRKSYAARGVNTRPVRQRFLIFCQGEETEANYFDSFRAPSRVVHARRHRCDPQTLVQKTIKAKAQAQDQGERYDQIWCVFDCDDSPAEQIETAMNLARKNSIQVAYSNEAFELWYLLHFIFLGGPITRLEYIARLENFLGHPYNKNSQTMYGELSEHQLTAIQHAERLLQQYNPARPAHDNPSTTVHLLVEQLNRFSRP